MSPSLCDGVVIEKDSLAVEKEIAPRFEERVQGHLGDRPIGRRHAREHVLVRDDRGRVAVDRHAGLRDRLVAARVVEIGARVDDPANRAVRQPTYRGEHRVAIGRNAGVDDEHAVLANLYGNVGTAPDQEIHVALHVVGLDRLLRARVRGKRQRHAQHRKLDAPPYNAHRFISRSMRRQVLGVRRRRTAEHGLERHTVELRVVLDERILARLIERHVVLVHRDFHDVLAVVEPVLVAALHEHELFARDVGFGQVHGVRDHVDVRQDVAVPYPVLHDRRQVAARDAAAAIELFLDVRRLDGEDVAVPLTGREAHVRVRHVCRRMRAAVHPDRAVLLVCAVVDAVRDDHLRGRILLFPDPKLVRAAVDVRDVVRLALVLEHRDARDVERLRVLARRVVQRHAGEIALHVAGHAVALVLVIAARPLADDADLRAHRPRRSRDEAQRNADEKCPHGLS